MAEFEDKLNALLSNPDAMGQIMSFAQSLGGDSQSEASPPPFQSEEEEPTNDAPPSQLGDLLSGLAGGLDPGMINLLGNIMHEYGNKGGQEDKNIALINALRPFLKEKRQAKIDQAIQLAKLSRIARVAFQSFKGGDEHV